MRLLVWFGLLAAAVGATAQPLPVDLPKPLEAARQSGLTVTQSFPAASGLTGWVLRGPDGKYNLVFTTADRQTLIAGALVDASGRNLVPEYADKYVPKPDYEAFWDKLERALWFADGATGKDVKSVIYAYLDPNCVFCNLAYQALAPYKAQGLQVRWVPVAFLRPDSAGKVAAILSAKNPAEAMAAHEAAYKAGGIAPAPVTAELTAKLKSNADLMRELGFDGTPAFLWKDPKTGKVLAKGGMLRLRDIPGMTGLPEQKHSSPDLASFAN